MRLSQNSPGDSCLKVSKYNVSIPDGPNSCLLANSLTTAVIKLKASLPIEIVQSTLLDAEAPFNLPVDKDILELLSSNGFIVPKDFDETEWLEDIHWKARNGCEALGIGVAVTFGCNFRCTYCYQEHQGIHLSRQLEEAIVRFVSSNLEGKSLLRVTWFGGEPLLRLNTISRLGHRLLELTQNEGVEHDGSITTNGFLLTDTACNVLASIGVTDVQVTLDGPPAVHNERRLLVNGQPTFQTILTNLTKAVKVFPSIIIRINIDKRNQSEVPELLKILHPLRERVRLAFRPATSPESSQIEETWCIPSDNYWGLDESLCTTAKDMGFTILRGYAFPGTSFCSGYQRNSITIDPFGDAHRCPVCIGRRNQRYGVLTSEGKLQIENGFQKQWDDWSPFLDAECRSCKALPVCMGGCLWYIEKGKSSSHRCFAKHRLAEGILDGILSSSRTRLLDL